MESFESSVIFEFWFLFGSWFPGGIPSVSYVCLLLLSAFTFKVDFLLFLIMLELFVIFLLSDCYDCLITTYVYLMSIVASLVHVSVVCGPLSYFVC